jgi:hypothetical protein
MSFTTTFAIEKPDYKTLRYDLILNANFDLLDTYLKGSPSASAPSSPVTLTEGVPWRDTTNHKSKVYGAAAWEELHSDSVANTHKNVSAPSTPDDGSFVHYANDVSAVACPHWKLQDGSIIYLCKQAHIVDIDATVITSLTNAYGTADGTLEDIGATNSSDVSGAIKNNFKECTTEIANVKTVVDDLRTKVNTIFTRLETLGLLATS